MPRPAGTLSAERSCVGAGAERGWVGHRSRQCTQWRTERRIQEKDSGGRSRRQEREVVVMADRSSRKATSPSREAARQAVVDALEPVLRADGVDLEDLQIASAGRRSQVRVIVDADSGMDLDGIARISQVISSALDDPGVAGAALDEATLAGPYTLEVSSPGVDRPLTLPRHWRRNIDRLVIIRTHSGDDVRGRIVEVRDGHATIEVEATGKAARAQGDRTQIQFDDVQRATIEVEFRRPGRTGENDADKDDADKDDADTIDAANNDEGR